MGLLLVNATGTARRRRALSVTVRSIRAAVTVAGFSVIEARWRSRWSLQRLEAGGCPYWVGVALVSVSVLLSVLA